jgi:hypothetical protein
MKGVYELNKVFQNVWSVKLPWTKLVVDAYGKVHQVKCKVYTKIECKEKLFAPKLDNLWKHSGKRKALATIPRVCKADEYHMNKDFVHAKNEHLYCLVRKDTIANQICHVIVSEKKKKLVQFYVWFHMLIKKRPMTYDYENMSKVLHFFDVENFPKNPLVKHSWLGDGSLQP